MAGMLLKTMAWAAGLTLFLWGVTRLMENRMTYYPFSRLEADPSYLAIDYQDIFFETGDGLRLHGWYCPPLPGRSTGRTSSFSTGTGGTSATACPTSGAWSMPVWGSSSSTTGDTG